MTQQDNFPATFVATSALCLVIGHPQHTHRHDVKLVHEVRCGKIKNGQTGIQIDERKKKNGPGFNVNRTRTAILNAIVSKMPSKQ